MSDNETTFHNEDAVFRIAMWANIISWVALAVALLQVVNGIVDLYPQWDQFLMSVPEFYKRALILINYIVAGPVTGGLFAFLTLRGVSQGLYLLMDFYMDEDDFEDFDDEEDEEDEE
jgi:hypothetical protein